MRRTIIGSILVFVVAAATAAIALSAAMPTSGTSAVPRGDPGVFVKRVVRLVVEDRYPAAWRMLYPEHKRAAPLDEYVACELASPVGWKFRSAKVLRVAKRSYRIPGDSNPTTVTTVTLRIHIANPSLQTEGGFVHTFKAAPAGSRWAWILTPDRYELYRSDACEM